MRVSEVLFDGLGAAYETANSRVETELQQLAGAERRSSWSAESFRGRAVPTELLATSSTELELPNNSSRAGCCIGAMANRPRLVVLSIYLIIFLVMGLQLALGDLTISVEQDAFEDKNHIDVRRAVLVKELRRSSVGYNLREGRYPHSWYAPANHSPVNHRSPPPPVPTNWSHGFPSAFGRRLASTASSTSSCFDELRSTRPAIELEGADVTVLTSCVVSTLEQCSTSPM
jgi:hypothetical protein